MPGELSNTPDPALAQDRSAEINALNEYQPQREPDSAPTVRAASQRALVELYRWFDTDDRFTRRLDAIAAYIASLEATQQPRAKRK
jgi:hypothetical protein